MQVASDLDSCVAKLWNGHAVHCPAVASGEMQLEFGAERGLGEIRFSLDGLCWNPRDVGGSKLSRWKARGLPENGRDEMRRMTPDMTGLDGD